MKIISTHPTTDKLIRRNGNQTLSCWTQPLFMKNEIVKSKPRDFQKLGICFSSIGDYREKGAYRFVLIALLYRLIFPKNKARFLAIGSCPRVPWIKRYAPMSFSELQRFYMDNVDVVLNPTTHQAFNGWPLSLDAVKVGCVMITTDVDKIQSEYAADDYKIIIASSVFSFIASIRALDKDSELLKQISQIQQCFVHEYSNYERQQAKIFEFLRSSI